MSYLDTYIFNKHNDFTIDVFPYSFRPVIQIPIGKSKSNKTLLMCCNDLMFSDINITNLLLFC